MFLRRRNDPQTLMPIRIPQASRIFTMGLELYILYPLPEAMGRGGCVMDEPKKEFTCDTCGGTFEEDWSDEKAMKEFDEVFPDFNGEVAKVCDDCYEEFMREDA